MVFKWPIIPILFFVGEISCIYKFYRDLQADEIDCLYDYYSDRTLVIYNITSVSFEMTYTVTGPDEKTLDTVDDQIQFKYAFTTYTGGYYRLCVHNKSKELIKVRYDLRHGIAAKDYSSVSKKKDLKPIDQTVTNPMIIAFNIGRYDKPTLSPFNLFSFT